MWAGLGLLVVWMAWCEPGGGGDRDGFGDPLERQAGTRGRLADRVGRRGLIVVEAGLIRGEEARSQKADLGPRLGDLGGGSGGVLVRHRDGVRRLGRGVYLCQELGHAATVRP